MATKPRLGAILSRLIEADRFDRKRAAQPGDQEIATAFGVPLLLTAGGWYRIDMSPVRLITGLTESVTLLVRQFEDQCRNAQSDVLVQQPIEASLAPELAALGVAGVGFTAPLALARSLAADGPALSRSLRRVLTAVQNPRCRATLFPAAAGEAGTAWLFQNAAAAAPHQLLLEYEPAGKFLRITADLVEAPRLNLKRLRHLVAEDETKRFSALDIGALVARLRLGIHQECQAQKDMYEERPERQPELFAHLAGLGLADLLVIAFRWTRGALDNFLLGADRSVAGLLERMLLLLGDEAAVALLRAGHVLEVQSGERSIFLDLSRLGGCLNASFDRQRARPALDRYLDRLPQLRALAAASAGALANVRVLLVHHITAETLAVIKAYDLMECRFLHALFIRYKGPTPDEYLEPILAMPPDRFRFHSLQQLDSREMLGGRYVLARQYSALDELSALDRTLREHPMGYTTAMRHATAHLFFRHALQAEAAGERVILVEDGGYLAPLLNRWCLEEWSLERALAYFQVTPEALGENYPPPEKLATPLREWLPRIMPATVEHTRNGYDALMHVQQEFQTLALPAYSIALSQYKSVEEGRGCAQTILMVAELIMNSLGDSPWHRHAVVFGARGQIGRQIMSALAARLQPGHLIGLDLTALVGAPPWSVNAAEHRRFSDIPEEARREIDFVLGLTGASAFRAEDLQYLLLNGARSRIYLVSGSTKNVEYAEIREWLQDLRGQAAPRIHETPVTIEFAVLRDPVTAINMGERVLIGLPPGTPGGGKKEILILADGMPLNFLLYGVPADVMDGVMRQLVLLTRLAAVKAAAGEIVPPKVLALDVNLDEAGTLIG